MPATTDEPVSGIDGRVIVEGTTVGLITSWTLEGQTSVIKIPHFEGPTDALSRMWTPKLFGLSDGQGTIEGYFNTNIADATDQYLTNGITVSLGLILIKGTSFGFGVEAKLSNLRTTDAVENQPAKFTCTFEVDEEIPLSSIGIT